jgi:hypothetical protein
MQQQQQQQQRYINKALSMYQIKKFKHNTEHIILLEDDRLQELINGYQFCSQIIALLRPEVELK